jgi:Mg-chelatase subunit ChlD
MSFNLDENIGAKKSKAPKVQAAEGGELGLVLASKSAGVKPAESQSLDKIYQELQKLIYLIDHSGSMNEQVAGSAHVEYFLWSAETMAEIASIVAAAVKKLADWKSAIEKFEQQVAEGKDGDDDLFIDLVPIDAVDKLWAQCDGFEGEDLKVKVLQLGLNKVLYLPYNWSKNMGRGRLDSKLEMVKKLASKMVRDREAQFKGADTMVIQFADGASKLPSFDAESLVKAIEGMSPAGGTDIKGAVKTAMTECRRRPSAVNLHHIVLVTDGEDWSSTQLPELIPEMKSLGVVLDFIYIANPGDTFESSPSIAAIKQVCDTTGGTCTIVTSASEFETKFVEASQRKCLPPAN